MLFSILVLSIPSRFESAQRLLKKMHKQIKDGGYDNVEVLMLYDNKKHSIGAKREILLQMAQGHYLSFIDDDDDIHDHYIKSIVECAKDRTADVIAFNVDTTINGGNVFVVRHSIYFDNEEVRGVDGVWQDIKRKPFHTAAWSAKIAKSEHFADVSYVEDWDWLKRLIPKVKVQKRIDSSLICYNYDKSVSESDDSVNFRNATKNKVRSNPWQRERQLRSISRSWSHRNPLSQE